MRYITERELRDLFSHGIPAVYDTPPDCKLTPAARQYLLDLKLYRPGGSTPGKQAAGMQAAYGSAPSKGGVKPEHMTHLRAGELVCKTHPRIKLRGQLDLLESELLLLMCEVSEPWTGRLNDALLLLRQCMAADVKDSSLPPWQLDHMDEAQVHRCSHHPEEFGFTGHILPQASDGRLANQLNRLRALSRQVELAATEAYVHPEVIAHEDILTALNRLSSYFYVLQLRAAREG